MRRGLILIILCGCLVLLNASTALGWSDRTHLAVGKAAQYEGWYNAAAADMARLKFGATEGANHWCNNSLGADVTPSFVLEQVPQYNKASDSEGHLYGAIIASLRAYMRDRAAGKYSGHHLAFCAHYIGELSMPLHNVVFDEVNASGHGAGDGTVELGVLNNIGLIQKEMYSIGIRDDAGLASEIARVANAARKLAAKLRDENRAMTQDEAYTALSHSASLLRAVLAYANGNKGPF